MNRKFTFLLVIATLLMALSIQAQNVRQAFKKSVATSAKILGKPGELKGAQKKLTAQDLKAAKKMGDVKRKKPAKRRNIVFRDVTPVDRTVPYDAYFADSDEAMSDFIVLNNNNDESDGEPCTWKWGAGSGAYYSYNEDGVTPADDYLVLPIVLEAGKTYDVTVNAAVWNYAEVFEVVAATYPAAFGSSGEDVVPIIEEAYPENDPADFTGTFTPEADGVYYIAIHVYSEADMYMLSIYRFAIDVAPDAAAPAAPSDFTAEQVEGELKTFLQFTAPTTTIGGDELTGNIDIEILRNGAHIATMTDVVPGTDQTYVDEVPAEGTYRYQLVASNAAGKGRKSDNPSVKVVMPKDIPYAVNFNNDDVFDYFTIVDNNYDGSTWTTTYIESDGMVAAYNYDWDNDADDYLISQPLRLQGGKRYEVTIRAAASLLDAQERLEVVASRQLGAFGGAVEDLITVIEPTDVTATDFVEFSGTFAPEEDGIYYVAVHAISDASSFYLYVSDLIVELGAEYTAPAAPTLTVAPAAEGALSAVIQVTAPGQCVDGSELTAITKIELYRDRNLIGQQDNVTPGDVVTFTDNDIESSGLYYYYAVAYNENGNGEKSEKQAAYIGLDQPKAPKGVQAVDHGTSVDFSWEAVTQGLHNGYVNPDDITYGVWTLVVSPFSTFFDEKLASVTGETAVTVDFNTDEGEEQGYTYFAVTATNESTLNEEDADWGFTSVFTGKPYDMPFTESFANEELHYFWDSNGMLMIADYASDGDDSALALLTEAPGNIVFMSGKLNLKDTTDPKLVFSALSPNISQLHILGDTDGNSDWKLLQTVSLTDEDYQSYQVSLASLKNHERFAQIAFIAQYETAATTDADGYLEDYGDYIFLDGLHIGDIKDNDLAIQLFSQATVAAGVKAMIAIGVENVGLQPASNYTVTVKADDVELLSKTITEELASFKNKPVTTGLPTTVFDETGDVTITATISYDADQDNSNNTATFVITIVEPDVVAPESLVAEKTESGVQLSWEAPATVAMDYTEDFEKGSGGFTQIDANDDGNFWDYMNNDELKSHSGTCGMQSYSWNPVGQEGIYPDNWLVTPLAVLDGTFSFWAAAQDGEWTDEHFAVYVSTKGNESVDDFEMVSDEFIATGWPTEYTVDLSSYAGQMGYIAIRHFNSYDNFALVVDDISFTKAPAKPYSYNIYADGQLVASVDASELSYSISDEELTDGEHTFAVTAIYTIVKESRPATATITIATDISQIATEKFVDVYSIDGKLLRRQATTLEGLKGICIVNGKAVMVK